MIEQSFSQKPWLNDIAGQLGQLLEQQRLPHGILFHGHPGSGTRDIGYWLSRQLLCTENGLWGPACGRCKSCSLLRAGNHPDLVMIESDKAHIGVDSVRKATRFLVNKAQLGQAKVVIIEQAEQMTEAAANALLKTLEEPTPFSFLFLISHDSDRLLPTIQSRCTRFDIRPPIGQGLKQSLGNSGLIDDYSNMSHLAQLQDADIEAEFVDFESLLTQWLQNSSDSEALALQLIEQPLALSWLTQHLTSAMRSSYRWHGIRKSPVIDALSQFEPQQLHTSIQLINTINQQLKQLPQANKKFMIESLVIDLVALIGNNAEKRPH
ncbi:DNA polymerase III subunit delta' [Thalassotalea sp. PS06]|uniref:DNA polymerase III subunit delta' n=1 Tax=Thalassotalea sp. PS06 TaxID=2594005 RepID=UPI0011632264|nr:DNA polymerase III subunit delta' [Thalassotalea sp. PS06]QDP01140.1 DNA polymerase III subunit delta' [Thalassotalea sp. PS06]